MTSTAPIAAPNYSLWPAEPPALRKIDPPPRLLVPLSNRGLASAKPPGTRVVIGEALVDRADELSHIPIAPFSGKLGTVIDIILTNAKPARAIELFVEADRPAEPSPIDKQGDKSGEKNSEKSADDLVAWIDQIRRAGVAADRRSSPDLIGQLTLAIARPIEHIIITSLDSDAGLRLNATLTARYAQDIAAAAQLLGRLTQARSICIALEAFCAPQWSMPIRAACRDERIRILDLENDYPQTDPTLMLYTIARRRFRPIDGVLPVTEGVLLLDAAAAVAVGQMLRGKPARFVPVGIDDHIRQQTHLLSVPIGTRLDDLLAMLFIPSDDISLRGGDLLRDIRLKPDTVLAAGELMIHVAPREMLNNPEPCVRCGWCLEACPTRVQPAGILEAAQRGDLDMAQRAGIQACIDCGLCSHVCPSRLPLLEALRQMRTMTQSL